MKKKQIDCPMCRGETSLEPPFILCKDHSQALIQVLFERVKAKVPNYTSQAPRLRELFFEQKKESKS
jgi:hypothetical protein